MICKDQVHPSFQNIVHTILIIIIAYTIQTKYYYLPEVKIKFNLIWPKSLKLNSDIAAIKLALLIDS
ncbi:hypothetical protein DERP_006724 [Dermatophagoides pteronyssinus]|uniref:Uncharacterized protein n=1 Tax=Dermatophagoides pteronyssinus TaxID=6956 RepID=A0ABQ8IRU6_DERPT|nr:hypothetical protein DERP_006724 [Dermatophagoides pteronyssinus]